MNEASKFISYFEAKQHLAASLHSTQDEIAQWVSIGANEGGLNAFPINDSDQSPFSYKSREITNDDNYIKPLEKLGFFPNNIDQFIPTRRYITRSRLIERWVELYSIVDDSEYFDVEEGHVHEAIKFFQERMSESDCLEHHPISGIVNSSEQSVSGLFDINDIQKIEATYNHKHSRGYRTALSYLQRKEKSGNKELDDRDEDEYMNEHEREIELERISVLEKHYESVVFGEVKFSLVPYDEFMDISDQDSVKKCGFIEINNKPTIKPTTPKYGEPELLINEAINLLRTLHLLGNDWKEEELALHLFNGTVRAFEKSGVDGMLRPVVNIQDWLIQYGKCVSFDDKLYSIKDALLKFNYSKLELSKFKPKNRYISFQEAQTRIATLIDRDIYDAELYLIDVLEQQQIYAFHFFVGQVTPELSINGELWRNGYFAEWQFSLLISRDFGKKESARITAKVLGAEDDLTTKPRKKLKAKERDTNEGLLLLYEIFKFYDINYLDQLPGPKAWGKIVSKEFNNELIKCISDTKKYITLNGGETLDRKNFLEKYRKRFK